MIPDHSKAAIIWLWHRDSGARANFDIIVYGVTKEDLLTVPNEIVDAIAFKYPDYVASPFGVETLRGTPGKKRTPAPPPPTDSAYSRQGRAALRKPPPHPAVREGLPVLGIRDEDGSVRMKR